MNAAELAFWLRWYEDWDSALGDGGIGVDDCFYNFYAEPSFNATVHRLNDLLNQAANAPVPKAFEQAHAGRIPGEADAQAEQEGDWPGPSIYAEARLAISELIREPYVTFHDYDFSALVYSTAIQRFGLIYDQVRAIDLIRNSNLRDASEIANSLQPHLTQAFEPTDFNFLCPEHVGHTLKHHNLRNEVMTPFHRFIQKGLSLHRLVSYSVLSDNDEESEDLDDHPKRGPDECEQCWQSDEPCQRCQERQDAFDACDDSHPDYYD